MTHCSTPAELDADVRYSRGEVAEGDDALDIQTEMAWRDSLQAAENAGAQAAEGVAKSFSDRFILSNLLMDVATTKLEQAKLKAYQELVKQYAAANNEEDMQRIDAKLLELERMKPIKDILTRERKRIKAELSGERRLVRTLEKQVDNMGESLTDLAERLGAAQNDRTQLIQVVGELEDQVVALEDYTEAMGIADQMYYGRKLVEAKNEANERVAKEKEKAAADKAKIRETANTG